MCITLTSTKKKETQASKHTFVQTTNKHHTDVSLSAFSRAAFLNAAFVRCADSDVGGRAGFFVGVCLDVDTRDAVMGTAFHSFPL